MSFDLMIFVAMCGLCFTFGAMLAILAFKPTIDMLHLALIGAANCLVLGFALIVTPIARLGRYLGRRAA